MKRLLSAMILIGVSALPAIADGKPVSPIPRAHAHNDYEHTRPLLDALDQGFCSVEADIFLTKDGNLLVAHTVLGLKKENTLQKLYLDPLRQRAKANDGRIHPNGPAFYLLIDIKTDAKTTFAALEKVLADYAEMLTTTEDGKTKAGAVNVIISGNTDREGITAPKKRLAAIDGRPNDLTGTEPAALIPWVSASWGSQFKWNGKGEMPADERAKLKEYVAKAHARGRMVRFWATPDKPEAWAEQLAAGVDLINTDKLPELREYLLKQPSGSK